MKTLLFILGTLALAIPNQCLGQFGPDYPLPLVENWEQVEEPQPGDEQLWGEIEQEWITFVREANVEDIHQALSEGSLSFGDWLYRDDYDFEEREAYNPRQFLHLKLQKLRVIQQIRPNIQSELNRRISRQGDEDLSLLILYSSLRNENGWEVSDSDALLLISLIAWQSADKLSKDLDFLKTVDSVEEDERGEMDVDFFFSARHLSSAYRSQWRGSALFRELPLLWNDRQKALHAMDSNLAEYPATYSNAFDVFRGESPLTFSIFYWRLQTTRTPAPQSILSRDPNLLSFVLLGTQLIEEGSELAQPQLALHQYDEELLPVFEDDIPLNWLVPFETLRFLSFIFSVRDIDVPLKNIPLLDYEAVRPIDELLRITDWREGLVKIAETLFDLPDLKTKGITLARLAALEDRSGELRADKISFWKFHFSSFLRDLAKLNPKLAVELFRIYLLSPSPQVPIDRESRLNSSEMDREQLRADWEKRLTAEDPFAGFLYPHDVREWLILSSLTWTEEEIQKYLVKGDPLFKSELQIRNTDRLSFYVYPIHLLLHSIASLDRREAELPEAQRKPDANFLIAEGFAWYGGGDVLEFDPEAARRIMEVVVNAFLEMNEEVFYRLFTETYLPDPRVLIHTLNRLLFMPESERAKISDEVIVRALSHPDVRKHLGQENMDTIRKLHPRLDPLFLKQEIKPLQNRCNDNQSERNNN